MGILLVVIVPMLNVFYVSSRNNVTAYRIKTATLIAQQCIEEFVGLEAFEQNSVWKIKPDYSPTNQTNYNEVRRHLLTNYPKLSVGNIDDKNHYPYVVEIVVADGAVPTFLDDPLDYFNDWPLIDITLTVSFDGKLLCTQSNTINAVSGGIIPVD